MGRLNELTPHCRLAKWTAKIRAEACRREKGLDCSWHFPSSVGCPYLNSNFRIHCKAVQEGHWTLIFMNCHCRDMRIHNERKQAHPA